MVILTQTNQGKVELEMVIVHCPECHQEVEAIAIDGRVKGYCSVNRKYVEALIVM